MDYEMVAIFHPDSYIARRGQIRQGFDGQYNRSDSITNHSNKPYYANKISVMKSEKKNILVKKSTSIPPITETNNTSLGDVFTAILESKLSKNLSQFSNSTPTHQNNENPPCPIKLSPISTCINQDSYLMQPFPLYYRVINDRERQLNARCYRLLDKLNELSHFDNITRQFKGQLPLSNCQSCIKISTPSNFDLQSLHLTYGIQAYFSNVLHLEEKLCNKKAILPSVTNNFHSENTNILVKEDNKNYTQHIYKSTENCVLKDKPVETCKTNWNDELLMERLTTSLEDTISVDTLLRRLARSVSTRLSHKRALLNEAKLNLTIINKRISMIRQILRKIASLTTKLKNDQDICTFYLIEKESCDIELEAKISQVSAPFFNHYTNICNTLFRDSVINLVTRFDRLLSSRTSVIQLLCLLTRRLFDIDRRIDKLLTSNMISDESNKCLKKNSKTIYDACLFPLESRRMQLENQIAEAQGLRKDLEKTKFRLLSGLQYRFYVHSVPPNDKYSSNQTRNITLSNFNENKIDSLLNLLGLNQKKTLKQSNVQMEENIFEQADLPLVKFISNHLSAHSQALLIQLILETEIGHDQDTIDVIGEQLRLVPNFTP